MSHSRTKPRSGQLYETDFHAWTQDQAKSLLEHRWSEIDTHNLADEIKSLGLKLEREIGDRLEILLSYLLKWQYLAEYRGMAWKENIDRQRREMAELFATNPSLKSQKALFVAQAYEDARRRLKYETYFYPSDFPASCPFTVEQVFDPSYFPEELDKPTEGAFPTARSIGR